MDEHSCQPITEPLAKANLFNDYFNSVFSQLDTEPPPPGLYPIVPRVSELDIITLSIDEVQKILSSLDPSKSPGPDEVTARLLKELAQEIAGPLTQLFNQSLACGKFPAKWKDANLIPVHKSGPKNTVTNYRGIALLSVVSKVLEKCVFSRIYDHVDHLLNPSQHGFRQKRSCVTQLIQYVHLLASTLDFGGQIDSIYLDMAKAFDRVPHQKLLYKLRFYGFRDPLLSWIEDYLTNRRHRVIIDGMSSHWKHVTSGVPQGSLIGPILFLIYINDISSDLSPDTILPLYADDAKCCRVISSQSDSDILKEDLRSISNWSDIWNMKFNLKKCKHLCITKKRNPIMTTYQLGSNEISLSKEEKDLGIIITHNLAWRDHILTKVNTANKMLRLIKRTCGNRPHPKVFLSLYIHLVRPHLEYACEVWSPHQAYLVDIIEGVQRRATRVIVKNKPYGERLKQLKLLTLASRRKYFDLIFLFKCNLGLCDINLSDYLEPSGNTSYNLRNTECSYKIKYARTNILKFSYFHRVIREWNDLPLNLRKTVSITNFKRDLKVHLYNLD